MKVAVCVDGSSPSEKALKEASEFVELVGGDVVLVHSVQESVQNDKEGLIQESDGEAIDRAESLLTNMKDEMEEKSNAGKVETELLCSNNGKVQDIISYVEEEEIDYVFIGHRALDKRKEELFGSFAKDMISKSTVPVTVVSDH